MKRIAIIFSVFVVLAAVTCACSTHEKCPAYGHYTEVAPTGDDAIAQK
ncbi:MAG: hypothetical protein J5642_06670 [Bacteroidales bacterium]|nr:hypothetical protein [Bacteroidales bacterium]